MSSHQLQYCERLCEWPQHWHTGVLGIRKYNLCHQKCEQEGCEKWAYNYKEKKRYLMKALFLVTSSFFFNLSAICQLSIATKPTPWWRIHFVVWDPHLINLLLFWSSTDWSSYAALHQPITCIWLQLPFSQEKASDGRGWYKTKGLLYKNLQKKLNPELTCYIHCYICWTLKMHIWKWNNWETRNKLCLAIAKTARNESPRWTPR